MKNIAAIILSSLILLTAASCGTKSNTLPVLNLIPAESEAPAEALQQKAKHCQSLPQKKAPLLSSPNRKDTMFRHPIQNVLLKHPKPKALLPSRPRRKAPLLNRPRRRAPLPSRPMKKALLVKHRSRKHQRLPKSRHRLSSRRQLSRKKLMPTFL